VIARHFLKFGSDALGMLRGCESQSAVEDFGMPMDLMLGCSAGSAVELGGSKHCHANGHAAASPGFRTQGHLRHLATGPRAGLEQP
jgi:hypothetical protein